MIPYLPSSISLDTLPLLSGQSHTVCTQLVHQNTPAKIQHHFWKKYVLINSIHYAETLEPLLQFTWTLTSANTSLLSNHLLKQPSHFPLQHRIRMNFQNKCKETGPTPMNQWALHGLALDYCVTELRPGKVSKIKWMWVKKGFSEGLDHKSQEVGLFGFGVVFSKACDNKLPWASNTDI